LIMCKEKGSVAYHQVEGVEEEVNTIQCNSISAEGFLANNDINATAICVEVLGLDQTNIQVHSSPAFWDFFFAKGNRRVLQACRPDVDLRTLVRLAYKSYQMGISFNEEAPGGRSILDLQDTIYHSHKEKIELLNKEWVHSPFLGFKIVKKHHGFQLERIITRIPCSKCKSGRANKNCKQVLCRKCCLEDDSKTKRCAAHDTGKKDGE